MEELLNGRHPTGRTGVAADCTRPTPPACGDVDMHFLSGMAIIDKQLVMLLDLTRMVETSIGGFGMDAAA